MLWTCFQNTIVESALVYKSVRLSHELIFLMLTSWLFLVLVCTKKSWRNMLCFVDLDITVFQLTGTSRIIFKYFCFLFLGNYSTWFLYVTTYRPKAYTFSTWFVKCNSLCMIRKSCSQSLFLRTPGNRGSTYCKWFALELYADLINILHLQNYHTKFEFLG